MSDTRPGPFRRLLERLCPPMKWHREFDARLAREAERIEAGVDEAFRRHGLVPPFESPEDKAAREDADAVRAQMDADGRAIQWLMDQAAGKGPARTTYPRHSWSRPRG